MEKGGRGLMLIDLEAKDQLAGAAVHTRNIKIVGISRGDKDREETLEIRSLNNARTARAKKGKMADLGFKPMRVVRVERGSSFLCNYVLSLEFFDLKVCLS